MSFFDMKKRRYGLSVIKLAKPTIKKIHRVIMPCKVNTPSGGPNNVTNKPSTKEIDSSIALQVKIDHT